MRTFLLLTLVLVCSQAHSGNGYYYGYDALFHLSATDTNTVFTGSGDPQYSGGSASDDYLDLGIHLGYKYKRHNNQQFFMAPEIYFHTQDGDDYIYSTNVKFGWEIQQYSWYYKLGLSRINRFDRNEAMFGLGLEYRTSDMTSIDLGIFHYDPIEEDSLEISSTHTIETHTKRSLNAVKIGITFYLHE